MSSPFPRYRRLAVLPLFLAVVACMSSRSPGERVGNAPSGEGELWVEVYNGMTEPVTVFSGRRALGQVNPAQSGDFRIPARSGRVFVTRADGQEVSTSSTGSLGVNHQRSTTVYLRYYRAKSTAP